MLDRMIFSPGSLTKQSCPVYRGGPGISVGGTSVWHHRAPGAVVPRPAGSVLGTAFTTSIDL